MKYLLILLKSLFILVAFPSCSLISSDQKVDKTKSEHYVYSKSKKKIVFVYRPLGQGISALWLKPNRIEMDADTKSFEVLGVTWAKDKNHFYFRDEIVLGVDYATTYYDSINDVLKDRDKIVRAYFSNFRENVFKVIEGVDPQTFHFIKGTYWAKDKDHYFWNFKMEEVDYKSFVPFSIFFSYDQYHIYYQTKYDSLDKTPIKGGLRILSDDGIFYDDNYIYLEPISISDGLRKISYNDIETFNRLENAPRLIFKLDGKVYYGNTLIQGADAATYQILEGSYYAKDKKSIYYQTQKVEDVDWETFEPIKEEDGRSIYGKDKYRVYYRTDKFPFEVDLETIEFNEKTHRLQDKYYRYEESRKRIKR